MSLSVPPGPKLLFFYGTLRLPHILKDVVGLDATPTLRDASVRGYTIKMWGPYPALIKDPSDVDDRAGEEIVTSGKAWMMYEDSHLQRLIFYETRNYRLEKVDIFLDDASTPLPGYTFVFNGRDRELIDGVFNAAAFGET
ncbi:hypothetical protein AAF712_012568 [Marasmius tenuissimus]|uniref:Putative gamma-glutamylcyclotransferase n=1 Tax=Marasmius tenuissimus TaxID=585030 RepID=A0ABR2ZGZ0_9AGAR